MPGDPRCGGDAASVPVFHTLRWPVAIAGRGLRVCGAAGAEASAAGVGAERVAAAGEPVVVVQVRDQLEQELCRFQWGAARVSPSRVAPTFRKVATVPERRASQKRDGAPSGKTSDRRKARLARGSRENGAARPEERRA
jgi:hypothetical protein